MEQVIKGYHANYLEDIQDFINGKGLKDVYRDDDDLYIGKGMYFWDNPSDQLFWFDRKLNNRHKLKGSIVVGVEARITFEEEQLLDLTDTETLKSFRNVVEFIRKTDPVGNKKLAKKLGYDIDRMRQMPIAKSMLGTIDVIRANLYYGSNGAQKKKYNPFSEYNLAFAEKGYSQSFTVRVKRIYTVKNSANCSYICENRRDVVS